MWSLSDSVVLRSFFFYRDSHERRLKLLFFSNLVPNLHSRRSRSLQHPRGDFTASSRGPWAPSMRPGLSSWNSSRMQPRDRVCSLSLPAHPRRLYRVPRLWLISKVSRHRRNRPPTTRSSVSRWWTSCSSIMFLWHRYRLLRGPLVWDKLPIG